MKKNNNKESRKTLVWLLVETIGMLVIVLAARWDAGLLWRTVGIGISAVGVTNVADIWDERYNLTGR